MCDFLRQGSTVIIGNFKLWNYLRFKEESFDKQPNSEGKLLILFKDMLRSVRDFPRESNLVRRGRKRPVNM